MDIKEIRLKSAKIEFQAKSDPAFLKQLRDDPMAVLQAEGLDYDAAQELTSQLEGDPAHLAARCPGKCDPLSCIVTTCCWFTLEEAQ
jgi:hypothetical protein